MADSTAATKAAAEEQSGSNNYPPGSKVVTKMIPTHSGRSEESTSCSKTGKTKVGGMDDPHKEPPAGGTKSTCTCH
eukprot:CAMPEP_0198154190 /NCGR_PEP_ID=MMETSP1443-20131203/67672_1 /TAXON_ID=186043 /ORGANISM="Entomoneis sp., Strain CCMP2396" /LENGTH=75 /DNA_ID=CAMNT_0043820815 /DNA_START=109 /DNA_END=333 /DNA_ORIENTATION=+